MNEEQLASLAFGLSLVGASIYFYFAHVRGASLLFGEESTESVERFRLTQKRRRTISTSLMGLIGVLIVVAIWIDDLKILAFYWLFVIFLVVWMIVVAVGDIRATRSYYSDLEKERQDQLKKMRG